MKIRNMEGREEEEDEVYGRERNVGLGRKKLKTKVVKKITVNKSGGK